MSTPSKKRPLVAIDHQVPIPSSCRGRPPQKYPWDTMKVGDSFFSNVSSNAIHSCWKLFQGRRPGLKTVAMTVRAVKGGVRVWRIK